MEKNNDVVLRKEIIRGLDVVQGQAQIVKFYPQMALCAKKLQKFLVDGKGRGLGDKITTRDVYLMLLWVLPMDADNCQGVLGVLDVLDIAAGTGFTNKIREFLQENRDIAQKMGVLDQSDFAEMMKPLTERLGRQEWEEMTDVAIDYTCETIATKFAIAGLMRKDWSLYWDITELWPKSIVIDEQRASKAYDFIRNEISQIYDRSLCLPWDIEIPDYRGDKMSLMEYCFNCAHCYVPNNAWLNYWARDYQIKNRSIIVMQKGLVWGVFQRGKENMELELLWRPNF